MDRRRAAGLLLALAACIATATAAPTASNHTALDLYDAAPDGCYYNFQHYGEGDRIMTNEPCLNCTCHNRMLMCYLRVCPFTKPIGQDCTIEKRADQCCPIVTCPDVPVDLLTSTTTSPAEYGPTGIGKLDKFGCSINGKYFPEGSKVPPTPNKPCEHCYCIRNMTTCVMQECTLHVDGCTPIYHKDVCCPVRYSCDHPEDEMPLLDDLSTTVRPTPGFLLTTTTVSPVTQISQDCVYDNRVFSDGALIKTEKACDHCYCMKGDIVCVVQECGTPMENEGKNCTASAPREGVCCPDTYICEGDESTGGTYEPYDYTTHAAEEELTTLSPPRRTSSEGSGYRNEPDEIPYTESPLLEPEEEGSGDEEEPQPPTVITPGSTVAPGSTDDILASTEETHEYIPLATTEPAEIDQITTEYIRNEERSTTSSSEVEKSSEPHQNLPSSTSAYSEKEDVEPITEIQMQDIGSGEIPVDESLKPHEEIPMTTVLYATEKMVTTTEISKQDIITPGVTERETSESQMPITSVPIAEEEERVKEPIEQAVVTSDIGEQTTPSLPTEHVATTPTLGESSETVEPTESTQISKETATKGPDSETQAMVTTSLPAIDKEVKETTDSAEQHKTTSASNEDDNMESQDYKPSTITPDLDDEFVTTESQEHEPTTETTKETEFLVPQHVTASTPMLEEIEKDTTEYSEPERIVPSDASQGDTSYAMSSTINYVDNDEKDVTESPVPEENITEDILGMSNIPVYDQQEITTLEPNRTPDILPGHTTEAVVKEYSESGQYSPPTSPPVSDENGRRTTSPDFATTISEDEGKPHDVGSSTISSVLESEGSTTEPDKGLNTIPSDSIEDAPVSSEGQKTTASDEKTTTESDLYTKLNVDAVSSTIPSKQTTISSDTSVSREEPSPFTTELSFSEENYSPTESQAIPELTTVAADITEEVISTLTHDHTKSTESIDVQKESHTTVEPKYTEIIEESTTAKESTSAPSYEPSTSEASIPEKDLSLEGETTTNVPLHEKIPETTANQEDNEISNEPRIPGEGDCLLNGVTYTNESTVPSTNKCQSGCKCISSIIKCDPIICSPPPEYMDNCETMYDTPQACCPTYICDHRTETIPPQSHSQMSGTEAPVTSHIHCHGDECEISKDKKHPEESSDACKSGNCAGSPDETRDTTVEPHHPSVVVEQPISDKKEDCVGDKCAPILCTDEKGCQASPVTPCEGENCEKVPDVMSKPEPCAVGEDCSSLKVPTKECSAGNCDNTDTQLEDSTKECTSDNCKRKDSPPLDQQVTEPCTELGCEQTQKDIESSTPLILQTIPQENVGEDGKDETSVFVTESTENLETPTETMQHVPSYESSEVPHEIVTEQQPEIVSDSSLTTLADETKLVTKSEPEPETTTKLIEFAGQQEDTSNEYVPDKNQLESTEEPGYLLPVSTEKNIQDSENNIPSIDETATGLPDTAVTSDDAIYSDEHIITTQLPQNIEITATTKPETVLDEETTAKVSEDRSTVPSETYTTETQEVTESPEKMEPEHITQQILEETSTEPSKTSTLETHETTKPVDEIKYDDTTKGATEEIKTEPSKTNDMKSDEGSTLPDNVEITTKSSTDSLITYATESHDITGSPDGIRQEEITNKSTDENITEPPKSSVDAKQDDITKEVSEGSATEPTKSFDSEDKLKPSEDNDTETSPPALPVDSQKVTKTPEDIEQGSTTIELAEEIGSESSTPFSLESQDVTESSKEKDHKDTPSIDMDETGTEPTKTYVTDSLDIIKPSEQIDNELTSTNLLVPTTESSISQPTAHEVTKSPQDLLHEDDVATKISDETSTIPPKTYSESEEDTKSSEDTEDKDITTAIEGTSTKPLQPYVTEATYPEVEDHEDKTSKISEESSTELPKTTIMEHEMTKSPETIDHEDTTTKISEETHPIVVEPQEFSKAPEDEKDTTSKISEDIDTESPEGEKKEVTKAPEGIDHEITTVNILEESSTELSKTTETEPEKGPVLPEIVDREDTTSKISEVPLTESSITYATEAQDLLTTPRSVEPIDTTSKVEDESGTEQPNIPVDNNLPESTAQPITDIDNEIEDHKPTIVKTPTEKPKGDEENLITGSEITDKMTTVQELFSPELTTPSSIPDSKKTTPDIAIHEEATSTALYESESLPTQSGLDDITESVEEQKQSTLASTNTDMAITVSPVTGDSEQFHVQPDPEAQTILTPTDEPKDVSKPDSRETISTQKPAYSTIGENPVQTATEEVSDTDELRTTSFELQKLTTLRPTEATQPPQDVEIKTDYPEISDKPQDEHSAEEVTTEAILAGTVEPAIPGTEIQTEKPDDVTETDFMEGTEFKTEIPQTSSEGKPLSQEESYTEQTISKYSSPAPTVGYDSTKSADDDVSTIEPMFQESRKPDKPVDGLSLVTEQYEISTKHSEMDSQTQSPAQASSAIPESDMTQSSEQDIVKDKLSTPSETSTGESDNKSALVTSTEYAKPVEEEISTKSPSYEDKTTTQKEYLPEKSTVFVQPSVPEQSETSTVSDHKFNTEHPDMIPTGTIPSDTSYTEILESVTTDKSLVKIPTESSYTTEASRIKLTTVEDQPSSVSDHDYTESEQEATKTPEIQIQEQTESSEIQPVSSTESPTLEPVVKTEPSLVEPTTAPKQEYSESTSSPLVEYTDKITDEYAETSSSEQLTTESGSVTESSSSPDVYTEKSPESIQTVTPEKAVPIEEFLTTRKQLEPSVYQTTVSGVDDTPEISTRSPVSEEDDVEHTSPKEQIIPVVITDLEKISTPEESVPTQTERVTIAPEKPMPETTAPEEEFILATSKATTTAEEKITTLSPIDDNNTRQTDAESPITTAPEAPDTITSATPITTEAEAPVTGTPDTPVTSASEALITTEAEAPITKSPEAPITLSSETTEPEEPATRTPESTAPESPVTTERETSVTGTSESPVTSEPEAPDTKMPESPVTTEPEASVTRTPETAVTVEPEAPATGTPASPIATEPEALVTRTPESPVTTETEAPVSRTPESPVTTAPESPVTTETEPLVTAVPDVPVTGTPQLPVTAVPEPPGTGTPEAPEAYVTGVPEVPVTKLSEASEITTSEEVVTTGPEAAITLAPETPITKAPEIPITTPSEAPITSAPELPKPVSTEPQPTEEVSTHDEEGSFPPSSGTSGYGQEPDYVDEDQTFGPGTCRYGGKVYVSAQQIPRDDPCDFCFCFRSDIICLQQSCPPPIHGCHEEPIQGFCCPRYECPVSMATTVNVTTTTTTTTTTLPPHFPTHSYKGSVQKRGCQIKGQTYKVGDVVRASSGPCLHCTCGGDGQMKCDPKVCTPEPMLRQMIAAAVSAKRRR